MSGIWKAFWIHPETLSQLAFCNESACSPLRKSSKRFFATSWKKDLWIWGHKLFVGVQKALGEEFTRRLLWVYRL